MTVKRKRDTAVPRVFTHKTADIRGGVSVAASELGGDFLREGAVLSAPIEGVAHVVKIGQATAEVAAADKTVNVRKHHNFKPGDAVLTAINGKAVAVTAVDESNKAYDVLTLEEAVGAIPAGGFVVLAKAKADSGASLKYEPQSVCGTGQMVDHASNIATDAWVIGVTVGNPVPSFIAEKLKGIINL